MRLALTPGPALASALALTPGPALGPALASALTLTPTVTLACLGMHPGFRSSRPPRGG
jgi:hypothetical protein